MVSALYPWFLGDKLYSTRRKLTSQNHETSVKYLTEEMPCRCLFYYRETIRNRGLFNLNARGGAEGIVRASLAQLFKIKLD